MRKIFSSLEGEKPLQVYIEPQKKVSSPFDFVPTAPGGVDLVAACHRGGERVTSHQLSSNNPQSTAAPAVPAAKNVV